MDEPKKQIIAILTTFTPADTPLILSGIKIATIFRKELVLVFHHKYRDKKKRKQIKEKLQEYIVPVKNKYPGLKMATLLISGPVSQMPERLADDYEAILILAEAPRFKYYSNAVSESPIPFLFINPEAPLSPFNKIVLPLDMRKENSDSVLWCSWFGRFNQAEIVVLAAGDKGKQEQKQMAQNVFLTKKLFDKFHIAHKIFKGQKSSLGNASEGMKLARSSAGNLLVILGSAAITPLDILLGLPERKIIRRARDLPVLLVNPRRDNYILCE